MSKRRFDSSIQNEMPIPNFQNTNTNCVHICFPIPISVIEAITDIYTYIYIWIHNLIKTDQLLNYFYFARVETAVSRQKQGKSEGINGCDWPSNLTQIGFKS